MQTDLIGLRKWKSQAIFLYYHSFLKLQSKLQETFYVRLLILEKDEGNVVIECLTGSDLSILLTSLSLILISKDMRTIKGF